MEARGVTAVKMPKTGNQVSCHGFSTRNGFLLRTENRAQACRTDIRPKTSHSYPSVPEIPSPKFPLFRAHIDLDGGAVSHHNVESAIAIEVGRDDALCGGETGKSWCLERTVPIPEGDVASEQNQVGVPVSVQTATARSADKSPSLDTSPEGENVPSRVPKRTKIVGTCELKTARSEMPSRLSHQQ